MYRAPEYLIELCQEDFDVFVAVLEHPPEPNKKLRALLMQEPCCGFCGLPESQGGGKIHDVAGHLQTFCCGVVTDPCCEGTENGPGF